MGLLGQNMIDPKIHDVVRLLTKNAPNGIVNLYGADTIYVVLDKGTLTWVDVDYWTVVSMLSAGYLQQGDVLELSEVLPEALEITRVQALLGGI